MQKQVQTPNIKIVSLRRGDTNEKITFKTYSQMKNIKPQKKGIYQNNAFLQKLSQKSKLTHNDYQQKFPTHNNEQNTRKQTAKQSNLTKVKGHVPYHIGGKTKVDKKHDYADKDDVFDISNIESPQTQKKSFKQLVKDKIFKPQTSQKFDQQKIVCQQFKQKKQSTQVIVLRSGVATYNSMANDLFLLRQGKLQDYIQRIIIGLTYGTQTYNNASSTKIYFERISKLYSQFRAVVEPSAEFEQPQGINLGLFNDFQDILNKILTTLYKIFNLKGNNKKSNISLNTIRDRYNNLFQKLRKIQQNFDSLNNQMQKYKQIQKNKQLEKQKKTQQILNAQKNKLNAQISNLKQLLKQRQTQINNITNQLVQQQQKYNVLKLQYNYQIEKIKRLEQQSISILLLSQKYVLKQQASLQKDKLIKQIQLQKSTIQQLTKNNTNYQHKIQIINSDAQKFSNLALKYSNENKQLKINRQKLQQEIKINQCRQMLESSDILSYKDQTQKLNLCVMMQKQTNKRPTQFKLLYKFNKQIPTNFHDYIDGKPNLLLLIQLQNHVIIGGYSRDALVKNCPSISGFIFSLSQNRTYPLKCMQQSAVASVYDQFFIVFGNSQLRIRIAQDVLFSNFAITNSFFNSKNDKISDFLHNGQNYNHNTVKMIGYQFYQVIFD